MRQKIYRATLSFKHDPNLQGFWAWLRQPRWFCEMMPREELVKSMKMSFHMNFSYRYTCSF
jgi:hypothetical protein